MHPTEHLKETQRIKILIVDDHAIVRDGLRSLFKGDPQFVIVGEASDGEEALKLVAEHQPNVVILDISMPNLNGIEATGRIKKAYPHTKVMILTVHEDEEYIQELVLAGADGYIVKSAQMKEIFDGVRAVASGTHFFSPSVQSRVFTGLVRMVKNQGGFSVKDNVKLTKRELEILRLIAEGWRGKEIAEKLSVSAATVHSHRINIMKKLDIHDTARLVKFAIQKNLVDLKSKEHV